MKITILDILGIVLFYGIIVFGVIALNSRYEQLCENGNTHYCPVEK